MKTILSITLLLSLSLQCFSQSTPDKSFYEQKAIKYAKMKKTGTALTVAGGILTTVGIIVLANSSISTYDNGYGNIDTTTEGNPGLGAAAFLLGMGGLGAGIPLAIVGSKNKSKYEAKAQSLSIKFNARPTHQGIMLAYRF